MEQHEQKPKFENGVQEPKTKQNSKISQPWLEWELRVGRQGFASQGESDFTGLNPG